MALRYWNGEWPNLNNVSLVLDGYEIDMLSNEEHGIFARLVWHLAACSVNSFYHDPSPHNGIPSDIETLARIARTKKSRIKAALPHLMNLFVEQHGRLFLRSEDIIRISGPQRTRNALPASSKKAALGRAGKNLCLLRIERRAVPFGSHLSGHQGWLRRTE